jgi:N-acetylmuramate 1-kinase
LVLLEDLGDLTLERKFWENQDPALAIPQYTMAIQELLKMHYPSTLNRSDATCFQIQFDTEKLLWELNYGREHLLTRLQKAQFSKTAEKALDKIFLSICERLHAEPKFIAHRDYHSRNVMLKHGKARVIDFQDARLGAIQYDLVSLMRDSYVAIDTKTEKVLLDIYLDGRKDMSKQFKLPAVERGHFDMIFELQTIQRSFKACGSFASFYNLRNDTRYLKYLKNTLKTVRASLAQFSEYREFEVILEENGVFDKDFESMTATP